MTETSLSRWFFLSFLLPQLSVKILLSWTSSWAFVTKSQNTNTEGRCWEFCGVDLHRYHDS